MAGWHRSVYGIERRGANQFHGLVEGEATVDIVAQALQVAECGVALVAVIDVLGDAQFLQCEYAADTEQYFLLESVFPVAAIQGVGDGSVELRVHVVVGVKQIELDTAHIDLPYEGVYLVVHIGHIDHYGVALGVEHTLDGQRVKVLCVVLGYLLAVHAEALGKVAVAIQESNGAEVYVAVAGLLEVVASQHAQTAGVDFKHLVDTVLHTEVGHRGATLVGLYVHVCLELMVHILDFLQQNGILDDGFLALVTQTLQEQHGVVAHGLVEFLVQALEHVACLVIPAPPHIVG